MKSIDRYCSPQEVADSLGVSYRTVHRLIKNKKLKASRVGAQWRVNEGDLNAYLKENSNKEKKDA